MEKLDPKAVWLFFFQFFGRGLYLILFLGLWFWVTCLFIGKYEPETWIEIKKINWMFSWWLVLFLILYVIFCYIWARLSYRFYRYELIENGFRKEKGVIWKKYTTIPYDRIQNVDIYRGVLARILGLSDLNIQTAGMSASISRYGIVGGAEAEGRLPGLSRETAEQLRDELIRRARQSRNQGL